MKKLMAVATAALIGSGFAHAADPSEEGVPTSPLKIYGGGFATGALVSLNEELQEVSRQFFRLSMVNTFTVRNGGVGVGNVLDVSLLALTPRRLGRGFGVGGHYIDRDEAFGDAFGPSLTAHAGFSFDLSDHVAVRMRLPYHFVLTERRDHAAGLDFGFIFSNRFSVPGVSISCILFPGRLI